MERRLATGLVLFHLLVFVALCGANSSPNLLAARGDLVEIDGVTYYVDAVTQMDYFEATAACQDLNMTLLRFETVAKSDLIFSGLSEYPDRYLWTAGRSQEEYDLNEWFWGYNATFGPIVTEFDWATGMPVWPNNNRTSCICFVSNDPGWKDHICDIAKIGFVCQPIE